MAERILAYILLGVFFLMDFIIRKDRAAKNIKRTKDDKNSTKLIIITFCVILVLSEISNFLLIGTFNNRYIAIIALLIMLVGIIIRIYSMLTLSKFYTRTLITTEKQQLVKSGFYKIIRHPGYLGTILIWISAGLAMQNIIVFMIAVILIPAVYYYRIVTEEKMLLQNLGNKYADYKKFTWRLIPYIW